MALDTRGFFPDLTPNPALYKAADTIQHNTRYKQEKEYRRAKDEQADDWRKLNLVQDLTDLSKHQTSSDVANAVGNKKAFEILQKYTTAAKHLSPAELQAKLSQEMSGLIIGMDAMKNELDMSDEQLKLLKSQFPSLDAGRLAQVHRADILKRRMDANSNFVNPLQVQPSAVNLSDPEYLADYITGNKNLVTAITDPKGTEAESVLMGKQGDYTKFEGKLPFWKKPTYDRTKFNDEGFYTGKDIPSFQIKQSTLSSNSLPSSNGKPFMMVESDVYDRFSQDQNTNLELIKATKEKFPTYNSFSQDEKEYAKRHVLFNMLNTYDQSQLHPTQNVRPQVTRNYNRVSVNTSKEPAQIDLTEYKDVQGGKDITDLLRGVKVTGLPNGSSLLAESVVFDPDKQVVTYKEYTDDANAKPKTVSLTKFFQDIKTLNPALDMKFLEGLRKPITGTNTHPSSSGSYTIKGKKYTLADLKKMGYTEEQVSSYKDK